MKPHRSRLSAIPLTPREKHRKALSLLLMIVITIAVTAVLAFSGVFARLISRPPADSEQTGSQQAALIAEAGVSIFTSISPERGYEDWQLSLCSISTERFCTLIRSGFGNQVWEKVLGSNAGIVNLSTHAIARINPTEPDDHQLWRVRYELLSAAGEKVYSTAVAVVQGEGSWKFNGFAFLPESTPAARLRGFQEE